MIDVSTITMRSEKHRDQAARNVTECLREVENKKREHYSGTFNPNSHVLKTFAVKTFGALGTDADRLSVQWSRLLTNLVITYSRCYAQTLTPTSLISQ